MSELNAVVSHKIEIAPGLLVLRLKPVDWELPDFKAGQFIVVGVPYEYERVELSDPEEPVENKSKDGLIKKAYSVASSSKEKDYVELYITLIRSGELTPRLFNLEVGDKVWMGKKIAGIVTLDSVPDGANTFLIATGTGIAPHMSMLRSELSCNEGRKFTLIHGARHSWDLAYMSELLTMERLCPNFNYVPVISRPEEEYVEWKGLSGYLQNLWKEKAFDAQIEFIPASDSHFFLCGTPSMVDEFVVVLEDEGYKIHSKKVPGQIHSEKWW